MLGAGATKACGGPLTNEILPRAMQSDASGRLATLRAFLSDHFGLPRSGGRDLDFPQLPLLLSLLDTAIDREQGFGGRWTADRLRQVRQQAEYAVFRAIGEALRTEPAVGLDPHERLFTRIHEQTGRAPVVISLNYDLLADHALIRMEGGGFPEYAAEIATPGYAEARHWGTLLKIHGSMNWIYCGACHRLEMGIDAEGSTFKIASSLAAQLVKSSYRLGSYYGSPSRARFSCPRCSQVYRPVLITPTHLKDYRNPHISALWYRAERELQECTHAVFVGYSLPWDDVDVIYLFKRGLRKRGRLPRITVVEYAKPRQRPIERNEVGRRYVAVFGRQIDWQPIGFKAWLDTLGA